MRGLLRNYIAQECKKHIRRHYDYLRELDENIERKTKRIGASVAKNVIRPKYWSLDDRFNPFKTRVPKKLDLYSYTLAKKIKENAYTPARAVRYPINKEDGSQREVSVFQIPDAALSRLVYKSLLHKNLNRFSAYAYAYREDKGPQDAVYDIFSEWKNLDRIYIAEFDFSKFFDNISHKHLWKVLDKHGFLYTQEERFILGAFLASESVPFDDYTSKEVNKRTQGIPQGTSVSLFLANLACWELDKALERLGVGFCRYADDTVIWSESYSKVVEAYDVIHRYGEAMAVPINLEKSEGISLVTMDTKSEIKAKDSIEYLGYKLSTRCISIKEQRVRRIRRKLSYIVYQNLLQPLKQGIFNNKRLAGIDWDYIVTLSQIRRYLYGGINDEKLRKYIRGQLPKLNFRGLMSYYPLVNDSEQLSKLDGWLIYVLRQSLKKRQAMWQTQKGKRLPGPNYNWIDEINKIKAWDGGNGRVYDMRIPSFSLINKAMHLAISKSGIGAATHPASDYY
ncbi:reverse transcriptase domain-containing protein [Planctomycetota bacterium]